MSKKEATVTAKKRSRAKKHVDLPVSLMGEMVEGKLPRGATSLPRDVVESEQRKRLVRAIAKVVSKKGYADTTLTDITSEAGVSRASFYQLFRDKEECFLYGYALLTAAIDADLAQNRGDSGTLTEKMYEGLVTYFRRINADLELAKAFIGEAQSATAKTRSVYEDNLRRGQLSFEYWIGAVRSEYPNVLGVSNAEISIIMLGMNSFIISHIRSGSGFSKEDIDALFRFILTALNMREFALKGKC